MWVIGRHNAEDLCAGGRSRPRYKVHKRNSNPRSCTGQNTGGKISSLNRTIWSDAGGKYVDRKRDSLHTNVMKTNGQANGQQGQFSKYTG